MNKKSETRAALLIWVVFFIIIVSTCSCATQSNFAKQEKQLCTPDHKAYKIAYITDKRIYLENYPGDYIVRTKSDTTTYKIGGEILIPIQFTYNRY